MSLLPYDQRFKRWHSLPAFVPPVAVPAAAPAVIPAVPWSLPVVIPAVVPVVSPVVIPVVQWRRGWDSNPRAACATTRSPGVHLRPLGHLSMLPDYCLSALGCRYRCRCFCRAVVVACCCTCRCTCRFTCRYTCRPMAERVGFEPTNGDEPITRFRVVRDQPDSATSPRGLRSAVVCCRVACRYSCRFTCRPNGAPGPIRTGDPQLRRLLLYPS